MTFTEPGARAVAPFTQGGCGAVFSREPSKVRAWRIAAGVSEKTSPLRCSRSLRPRADRMVSCSAEIPDKSTVIWRFYRLAMASLRTWAPVASMVLIRDIRKMTTLISATADSSCRKCCAAAKNRGPSRR